MRSAATVAWVCWLVAAGAACSSNNDRLPRDASSEATWTDVKLWWQTPFDAAADEGSADTGAGGELDAASDGDPDEEPASDVQCGELAMDATRDAARDAPEDAAPYDAGCVGTLPAVDVPGLPGPSTPDASCAPGTVWCLSDGLGCGQDALTSRLRCGGCLRQCLNDPFSTAQCRGGHCERRCRATMADCDCDPTTACDTNIWSDARHCGGCGHACAAGESCVTGRCVAQGVRLKAPVSALRLHTARPWFRWALPACDDGVRLEVCATRTCDTVEHRWDVSGTSFRPPVALSPGVHFWRLTARRGDAFDGGPSAPWEFAIGPVPTRAASRLALLDVNGDGMEDNLAGMLHVHASWSDPQEDPYGFSYWSRGPYALGDTNGDGYGDVAIAELSHDDHLHGNTNFEVTLLVYRGSEDGLWPVPESMESGSFESNGGVFSAVDLLPVGDRNGDGFGDALLLQRRNPGDLATYDLMGSARTMVRSGARWDFGLYWFDHGDFNGDGLEDMIGNLGGTGATKISFSVAPGSRTRSLPFGDSIRCAAPAAPHYWSNDAVQILDANDDGYDDVLLVDAETHSGVLHPGGPMGLDGARCVSLPSP